MSSLCLESEPRLEMLLDELIDDTLLTSFEAIEDLWRLSTALVKSFAFPVPANGNAVP